MAHQIQRFNFAQSNDTSVHLKIIRFTLHGRLQSYAISISHYFNIIAETATKCVLFLEYVSKMVLWIDLMVKKMKEPGNVILAQ